jgi:glycine/D-amino acid oxidase-like deaminating enzyme
MAEGVLRIQQQGTPTRMVTREQATDIEPNLDPHSGRLLAYSAKDGAIDATTATLAMIRGLIDNGGELVAPATVSNINTDEQRAIVSTDIGAFEADLIVVAAGVNVNDMARMIGLKTDLVMPATPGVIVTTQPAEPLLKTVCYTSDAHFRQQADGRLVVAEKLNPPQTKFHLDFLAHQPNVFPTSSLAMQHAKRILTTAGLYVPQIATAEPEKISVGWRPLPLDGLPVIGHVLNQSRIYLASMHSGVTLAPIVGHLAAMEILDDVRVDLLEDFRVERFY